MARQSEITAQINIMNLLEELAKVTCFIFDVDGVLTDGSLLVFDDGQMVRRMNIKDGYALQLAVKRGYHVLIISGGDSPAVKERLLKLGVQAVFMKVTDKASLLKDYLRDNQLSPSESLFMGDDVPDLEAMKFVGVRCCPSDAVQEIKEVAHYISNTAGGYGCARDIIEKVMKLRGDWFHEESASSR
jgi:3-deoxy-D-manno-octulosonate 8-phosphate phosphatase (KDO 8-P phosphatase)